MLFASLLFLALPVIPVATPTPPPSWPQEPVAYKKVPFGLPYAEMAGRVLLTGCRPNTSEHESGTRTCDGNGFQANGVAVDDVFVFEDDVFEGATLSFASDDYEKLREVFQVKYGEPSRLETTRVTTRSGTRYDNETLNWDGRRVSVSLQRYGESLERGTGSLFLSSYLEALEKKRQEKLKKDADAF